MDAETGVVRLNEILNALMLCTEKACEYCPYNGREECRINLLNDAANARDKETAFRRHMFNRCVTLSRCDICGLCVYADECKQERTASIL